MLSVEDCLNSLLQHPMEYKSKWGLPLWYECWMMSPSQLHITFTGGRLKKYKRTEYLMEFKTFFGKTFVFMYFHKEFLRLPAMTSEQDIDLLMIQKLQAQRLP